MDDSLSSCLDLMRRLPPQKVQQNLDLLINIVPDLADDILSSVDQPLQVQQDAGGRDYLVCDYNRDGDSYRSPWTNTYLPQLDDGTAPSPKLRTLEVAMNDAFDVYRDLYFEGGVSSVYLWDMDDGFAGVVLLKKETEVNGTKASWDSIHVFETSERSRTAHYKVTSTVMLYMAQGVPPAEGSAAKAGEVALGGSMTRQNEADAPHDPSSPAAQAASHISNLGRLVEDMEIKMRNLLQDVYFSKTKEITSSLRSSAGYAQANQRNALQSELAGLLGRRKVAV